MNESVVFHGGEKVKDVIWHYDRLIEEGNDPVHDPKPLREYMDRWDGLPMIQRLQLSSDQSVLEFGVGTGRLAVKVAPHCKSFCGIDLSEKTVERAKENLCAYPNVSLICGDFITYPFRETFDVIYSSLTFMHIEDKAAAIEKVAALLRENGRFVLSIDKNQSEYLDFGCRKIRIYPDNPREIKRLLLKAKLRLEECFETDFAFITVSTKSVSREVLA